MCAGRDRVISGGERNENRRDIWPSQREVRSAGRMERVVRLTWAGLPYHIWKEGRKISESLSPCAREREDAKLLSWLVVRSGVERRSSEERDSRPGRDLSSRQMRKFETTGCEEGTGGYGGLDSGSIGMLAKLIRKAGNRMGGGYGAPDVVRRGEKEVGEGKAD